MIYSNELVVKEMVAMSEFGNPSAEDIRRRIQREHENHPDLEHELAKEIAEGSWRYAQIRAGYRSANILDRMNTELKDEFNKSLRILNINNILPDTTITIPAKGIFKGLRKKDQVPGYLLEARESTYFWGTDNYQSKTNIVKTVLGIDAELYVNNMLQEPVLRPPTTEYPEEIGSQLMKQSNQIKELLGRYLYEKGVR